MKKNESIARPSDYFYLFLLTNGCYYGFLRNFKPRSESDTIDHLFDVCLPEHYLSAAFRWEDTPEGSDFWARINKKWQDTARHFQFS